MCSLMALYWFLGFLSVGPLLQVDEEEGGVGGLHALIRLYPTTGRNPSPSVFMMISSRFRRPRRCAGSEEASGSWMAAKRYPWSSSGRKLVAYDLPKSPASAATPNRKISADRAFPDRQFAAADIPFVAPAEDRLNPS